MKKAIISVIGKDKVGIIYGVTKILSENSHKLYSYTVTEELRENTVVDPETDDEIVVTEIWRIYTIRYNGEAYFEDNVFFFPPSKDFSTKVQRTAAVGAVSDYKNGPL